MDWAHVEMLYLIREKDIVGQIGFFNSRCALDTFKTLPSLWFGNPHVQDFNLLLGYLMVAH